ncbi:hypothetical protein [Rhodococcus sp. H29-C3]|uniref:hypothetical protein n=1 Tax=Rhodococcus sp. H29-C3 TaxID=3046307 RepID=UPI0024BBC00D|nr:hypothetical protein [Rhodococcus sp. H29-C3]MDJ0361864.1 hypothetical protein [Rhodococcus sp. H29-C3]
MLRAASDAGVKRVVLTSAFHAVGFGHGRIDHTFTEDDWSVLDGPGMDTYGKSKILAERAAWDFVRTAGGSTELTTLLPVAVMGPIMGSDISGANHIIQRSLDGAMPGYPNMYIPIVDVRDVDDRTCGCDDCGGGGRGANPRGHRRACDGNEADRHHSQRPFR